MKGGGVGSERRWWLQVLVWDSLSCCRRPLLHLSDGLGREPKTASWLLIANFKHSIVGVTLGTRRDQKITMQAQ